MRGKTLFVLTGLLLSSACLGANGIYEINQVCAINDGCFPGDSPGFPVQIGNSGSYRLTSNLDVGVAGTPFAGIEVTAKDVSIDLAGFAIDAGGSCTGTPVSSCSGAAATYGIIADTASANRLSVANGTIAGVGNQGIWGSDDVSVRNVLVTQAGGLGISTGARADVQGVRVNHNGGIGLLVGDGSRVKDTSAVGNQGDGIAAGQDSVVNEAVATNNGEDGISVNLGSLVRDVAVNDNGRYGIFAFNSSSVVKDCSANNNASEGVYALYGGTTALSGCSMRSNNSGGPQIGGPIEEVGPNVCGNNTSCP